MGRKKRWSSRAVAAAVLLAGLIWTSGVATQTKRPLLVFGAASTADALHSLSERYTAEHGTEVRLSLAASSVLARQIEQGAPADLFISADVQWMDYLEDRGLVLPGTRRNLAGNRLVLVARRGRTFPFTLERGKDLPGAFSGRLAVGDPTHVPAGIYARQALQYFGWWDSLKERLAPAENVRAALRLVELGEAGAGIVYASDAAASDEVGIVAEFPGASHDPIVYPGAVVKGASAGAEDLLRFLASSEARPLWKAAGFRPPP